MDLDAYLDQLSAQLDDIHEARASGARVPPGSQALILLASSPGSSACRASPCTPRRHRPSTPASTGRRSPRTPRCTPTSCAPSSDAGGHIAVDAQPSRDAATDRAGPADDRAPDAVLAALERQLGHTSDRLREAIADYEALKAIAADATDPAVTGRAHAHEYLASRRWTAALGARAALEAAYQELAGRPSPAHEAAARTLAQHNLPPYPVGLDDRDPQTAAFLAAHATERDASPTAPEPKTTGPEPPAPHPEPDLDP